MAGSSAQRGVEPLRRPASGAAEGTAGAAGAVEVRRSARRRRTVSAYREGDRTVVLIPARFTRAEERRWVDTMLARLAAGDQRRRPSDEELMRRATELSQEYLGAKARPSSVRWVGNQLSRWGSCTPAEGTIRISTRLQGMPGYVIDYVLLHELAHLLRAAHDQRFWALLQGYPRLERARGYLEGYAAAGRSGGGDPTPPDSDEDTEDTVDTEDTEDDATTLF